MLTSSEEERLHAHQSAMLRLEQEAKMLYGELRQCALGGDDLLPIRLALSPKVANSLKLLLIQREQRIQQLEEEALRVKGVTPHLHTRAHSVPPFSYFGF